MLVFAEHRYYGESLPFGADTFKHMQWLSTEHWSSTVHGSPSSQEAVFGR